MPDATDRLPESRSLAALIATAIQGQIVDGTLSVAERLPTKAEMAERFVVSPATVPEALKIRTARKLTRSKRGPRGGVFVNAPSIEHSGQVLQEITALFLGLGVFERREIVETRTLMGRLCTRLAAERASDDDLARIAATLAAQGGKAISDEEFCRLDVAFHHAVAAATGNSELQFLMLPVNDALIPATNMISVRYWQRHRIVEWHTAILEALRRRDGDAAVAAFDALMRYLSQVYAHAVEARGDGRQ